MKLYDKGPEDKDDAVEDMINNGTSLDDAAEEYDVDRDDLSSAFGEEMDERYGDKE